MEKKWRFDFKDKRRLRTRARNAIMILAGNALLAFLVAAFVIPNDIIMGGTTGIGIVINKMTGFDTAVTVLILNVVLLILGWIVLGREFFLTTVVSSVLYPLFLGLFQRIPGVDRMTDDPMLAALFAGALMGLALGMVMRAGSSTGGMDILNLILSKWLHLPVGIFVYAMDLIVVFGQAPLYGKAEPILYGILVLAIESALIDQVMVLGKAKVQVYAVSPKHEEIRRALLTKAKVGVTMSLIETGGLKNKQMAVICVTSPRKLYKVTEEILAIDPEAFLTVTKIREVRGAGFTRERVDLDLSDGGAGGGKTE